MKALFLVFIFLGALSAQAFELKEGQRLAETKELTGTQTFPVATVTVTYVRHCSETVADILTRSQIAAGRNFLEVGVLLEKTDRPCLMHEPLFVTESMQFQIWSELPLNLFRLDLTPHPTEPFFPGGSTVGNFD